MKFIIGMAVRVNKKSMKTRFVVDEIRIKKEIFNTRKGKIVIDLPQKEYKAVRIARVP